MSKRLFWSKNEDNILYKHYSSGNRKLIQKLLSKRSLDAIKARATLLQIPANPDRGKYMRKSDLSPLLKENNIAYYWLGFILADGNFAGNQLRISLSTKDKQHLQKLATLLKGKLRCSPSRKIKNQVSLQIKHASVVQQLSKKYKISTRKTYEPPSIYSIKNESYFLSLLAGYIDGDGCIYFNKNSKNLQLTIIGHQSWIEIFYWFHKKLEKILKTSINEPQINKSGYSRWSISKADIIYSLSDKIHRLNVPILKRKWDKIIKRRSVLLK